MKVNALVYEGVGEFGRGIYAHIINTNYTYLLSSFDTDWNAFGPAGDGLVFQGNNTSGFDDTLVYSDGQNETIINFSVTGEFLDSPEFLTKFGDETLFLADVNTSGERLYISDGASAPIRLTTNGIDQFFVSEDGMSAYYQDAGGIYRINQDLAIDNLVTETGQADLSQLAYSFEFNGSIWFRGSFSNSNYFYEIDGLGNINRTNIAVDAGGDNVFFYFNGVAENQFFFWNFDGLTGMELYISDGTDVGTNLVKDINPGTDSSLFNTAGIEDVATVGDKLFFAADDGSSDEEEVWVSDGTDAGTFALSGTATNVGALDLGGGFTPITVGNMVFFDAFSSSSGRELFVTDGTVAGTMLVKDIIPGLAAPFPETDPGNFTTDGTYLYFTIGNGNDGIESRSYWRTDGTEVGTMVVSDPGGTSFTEPNLGSIVQLDLENIPTPVIEGDETANTLSGTFLNEILKGLDGNDTLTGNAGDDILNGGDGDDVLEGGTGSDTADYSDAGSNVRIFLADTNGQNTLGAGRDIHVSIENVTGSAFNDNLYGDGGDNVLEGGDGDDRIVAGDGNDILRGGAGDDILKGRGGDDMLFGDAGDDIMFADAGVDTLDGGADNDFLYGGSSNDVLDGGTGDDRLRGNLNNDTLNGGEGIDLLFGGGQNDTLNGDAGNDNLRGENGNDILDGGSGDDVLFGNGLGNTGDADIFVFKTGNEIDRIRDWEDGTDMIDLTSYGFATAGDALAQFSQVGGSVRFIDGSDTLIIEGELLANITAADIMI